jgi:S1-C subfamily serine protease
LRRTTKVDPGSLADLAGLKAGEVMTELGGAPVRTRLGLLWVDDAAEPTVILSGKPVVIRATITDPQRARAQKSTLPLLHGAPMMWTWAHGVPAHMM